MYCFEIRGRQSIKKRVWYIGGRKRQKRGAFPLGLVASLAGPILGEVAKLIFKTILGRGIKEKEEEKDGKKTRDIKKEACTRENNSSKWKVFYV